MNREAEINRYEKYKRIIRFFTAISILAVETCIYAYAWYTVFIYDAGIPFFRRGDYLLIALYALILLFFAKLYGGFQIGYLDSGNVVYSQLLTVTLVNIITYIQIALVALRFLNPLPFVVMEIIDLVGILIWAKIFNLIYKRLFPPREMLLVYEKKEALVLLKKMENRHDRYHIDKIMDVNVGYETIVNEMVHYDSMIICDVSSKTRNKFLKFCYGESKRVYMTPKISDILVRSSEEINLFDTPLLMSRNSGLRFDQELIKRGIDLFGGILMAVLFSPFMLLVAIAIKLEDGGPIFYKQKRLTRGKKVFSVIKFRSMRVDAEKDGIARLATEGDPRITKVGRIIRACRIDEMPQVLNILRGDMSLVGPRPERPEIFNEYCKEMPEFAYRLKVKAGLTGYAQIYGKYNTSPYDKLKLDLMYIQNCSVILDLKLMIQTVKILFMKESTEGIEKGQTTAKN